MKAKMRILAILTAAMIFGGSVQATAAPTENTPTEPHPISQTEPTLLTNEELSELTETAPDITETRSAVTMTNRRMTETEIAAWIEEYWELGKNAFELEVVRLINIERENIGLHPLAINPQLSMAARFHSTEMADLQYFAHRSAIYGRGTARAGMFGHSNQQEWVIGIGENIHGGALSPERVMRGWMNSAGHRRAILCPDTQTIGIGAVRMADNGMGRTTAKFGF
jgi:uncharacterized protein YkwD